MCIQHWNKITTTRILHHGIHLLQHYSTTVSRSSKHNISPANISSTNGTLYSIKAIITSWCQGLFGELLFDIIYILENIFKSSPFKTSFISIYGNFLYYGYWWSSPTTDSDGSSQSGSDVSTSHDKKSKWNHSALWAKFMIWVLSNILLHVNQLCIITLYYWKLV